ncbi:MAG: hypothetical protein JNL08_07480 [Planctomycetes bacterium]|nr:hypothetical protein [Planctomycetota bacterium]
MSPNPRPFPSRFLPLAAALGLAACSDRPPAPADDRLLVVDGITITLAEVEPYVAFLDAAVPEAGRKTKIRRIVDEHLLPLRLAQRAFAARRAELREQAAALCGIATNSSELERVAPMQGDRTRRNLSRMQPRLPVAMFLFDPLLTGAVSPPIEVPNGWVVATAFDLHEGALMLDDYVDALQIGFLTHDAEGWGQWLLAERARVAGTVTWVHPDYREAMPDWLHLPRLQ